MSSLSKSKYLAGLQCQKYLWIINNEQWKIPKVDKKLQFLFDQGQIVEEMAKSLYQDGIKVPTDDINNNINQTIKFLKQRKILFEASILINNLYVRFDILEPIDQDKFNIIEIKSGTSIKEENIQDVAFQKYCCTIYGLKINRCYLMLLNKDYIKHGELNLKELFIKKDITEEVNNVMEGMQNRIDLMLKTISLQICPQVEVGNFCQKPYDCPLITECWKLMPYNNVFDLYRGSEKSEELLKMKIYTIKDIPDNFNLTDKQQIQKQCEKLNNIYIDKTEIKKFLNSLKYPLYFMDFESFNTAIPLYDGLNCTVIVFT